MTEDEQQLLKTLGARIAQIRKTQGLSRQTVADALGVAQQPYGHYEVGRVRIPVSLLPELAQFFSVSTDELLGRKSGAGKRCPTPKLQQQIERLHLLAQGQAAGRHGHARRGVEPSQPLIRSAPCLPR